MKINTRRLKNKPTIFIKYITYCVIAFFFSCNQGEDHDLYPDEGIFLVVLGTAQDAGYPQANCHKTCCKGIWHDESKKKTTSCLGIVDNINNKYYIFDATPDFKFQMERIQLAADQENILPAGIFLTHAHIGHYTGLMHLGREVIGSKNVPVYAMPKMREYLSTSGPWSQLVTLNNISLQSLEHDSTIVIDNNLEVTPILVPHRDEYSETVGFSIQTENKSILFIPDIDKWQKWERNIVDEIKNHDISYLDGSFFDGTEIPNRDMSEIPHPFLIESMELFKNLTTEEKARVHFIHFNHTNPVLNEKSEAYKEVHDAGFVIAKEGEIVVM